MVWRLWNGESTCLLVRLWRGEPIDWLVRFANHASDSALGALHLEGAAKKVGREYTDSDVPKFCFFPGPSLCVGRQMRALFNPLLDASNLFGRKRDVQVSQKASQAALSIQVPAAAHVWHRTCVHVVEVDLPVVGRVLWEKVLLRVDDLFCFRRASVRLRGRATRRDCRRSGLRLVGSST